MFVANTLASQRKMFHKPVSGASDLRIVYNKNVVYCKHNCDRLRPEYARRRAVLECSRLTKWLRQNYGHITWQ